MTRVGFIAFPFQVLSRNTLWLPSRLSLAPRRNVGAYRPRSDIALANTHTTATPKITQHKELVVPTLAGERNDHNAQASILLGFPRNAQGPRSCGQHWRDELVL
jgi:hypothetical protein